MNLLVLLVLLALAAWRLTRFATRDELPLIKTPRDAVCNWLDPRDEHGRPTGPTPLGSTGRIVAYGIECDWCMSAWISALLVAVTDHLIGVQVPVLLAGAVWGVAGLLAAAELHLENRDRLVRAETSEREAGMRRRGRDSNT